MIIYKKFVQCTVTWGQYSWKLMVYTFANVSQTLKNLTKTQNQSQHSPFLKHQLSFDQLAQHPSLPNHSNNRAETMYSTNPLKKGFANKSAHCFSTKSCSTLRSFKPRIMLQQKIIKKCFMIKKPITFCVDHAT